MLIWAVLIQFLPSSLSQTEINSGWISLYTRIGILLMALFILGTRRIVAKMVIFQIANIMLLFLFSWLTIRYKGFHEAYYNSLYYILLAGVFVVDLRNQEVGKLINILFYLAVIVFCILGIGVILRETTICRFLSTYYTRYWERSAYYSVMMGKPVGTYSVHSISGFMYFEFILMLHYKNKKDPKWYNTILIAALSVIIAMLQSNTAVMLLGLGALIILFEHRKKESLRTFIFKVAFVVAVCLFLFMNMDAIQAITGNSENGLLGRFTGASAFLRNIRFLEKNMLPIGFTGSSSLWLSDNGYIIAFLRGGIVNVLAIYGGLYFFLKRNVLNKAARVSVLLSIAAFEMAYPILLEIRYICFLPFLLVYLNTYAPAERGAIEA